MKRKKCVNKQTKTQITIRKLN